MPSIASSSTTHNQTIPNLDALAEHFHREGYVIVDDIFDKVDIEALRKAASDVISLTREGNWNHRRVVGKQFPPYDTITTPDSWGVQHLMHPSLPHHDTFAQFYGSAPLLDIAAHLLSTKISNMQLELFNLLIEPSDHYFALGWHRDDIRADVEEDKELERLGAPTSGIQWNACLYDDDCLFLVPRTHARLRTEEERIANQTDPPAARPIDEADNSQDSSGSWTIDPKTTKRVSLKGAFHPRAHCVYLPILIYELPHSTSPAGQTAFYSQRILHRASYTPSKKRATLHGCYGDIGEAIQGSAEEENAKAVASERARNVLQVSMRIGYYLFYEELLLTITISLSTE
jgi:hypothetical protein